jgi:hypothetical protein
MTRDTGRFGTKLSFCYSCLKELSGALSDLYLHLAPFSDTDALISDEGEEIPSGSRRVTAEDGLRYRLCDPTSIFGDKPRTRQPD